MLEQLYEVSHLFIESLNRTHVRDFLRHDPFRTSKTILLGQRGVGKTTIIIQYIISRFGSEKQSKALYLPADHILIGQRTLYEIADAFQKAGGELICFDEIHKYENWSQELKSIYDTFPNLQVIVSGSSALEIHKGSHDLSRRAIIRRLPGLSFREYLTLTLNIDLAPVSFEEILNNYHNLSVNITKKLALLNFEILPLFAEYLKKGYYPYFFQYKNDADYFIALEQSVHATIENDIQSIHPTITGAAIKKMLRLLGFIAQQVPYKPNLNALTTALDIADERTLKTYLKYLEDAGVINTLHKSGKRFSTLEKPDKIYLNNTNQMYAFGKQFQNQGTLRETFFLNAIKLSRTVSYPEQGDFNVNGVLFEVGGRNKGFEQIKNIDHSYLALDDIELGSQNVIPLWLFGFLY